MKKIGLTLIAVFIASFINIKAGQVSFNYFYSTLSPYGEWISLDYDLVVWRPNSVNYDWSPYRLGRWAWTDQGWYWDSYEPFGWAVYHYGRWHYDEYYGWVWIPDYEWAPAWVEWRYNNDYLGWAPLSPYASFSAGVGITFSINWHLHHRYWNFVTYNNFCHNNVNIYIVNNSYNSRIFSKTKYRTNYYADGGRIINRGIDRNYVERRAGYKISRKNISRVGDYNTYEKNIKSRNGSITAFTPSDKEISRYREVNKYNLRDSNGKSSLKRDKVAIRNRISSSNNSSQQHSTMGREVRNERNSSRESYKNNSGNKSKTKREYSTNRSKYSTKSQVERREVKSKKEVRNNNSKGSSKNPAFNNSSRSKRQPAVRNNSNPKRQSSSSNTNKRSTKSRKRR